MQHNYSDLLIAYLYNEIEPNLKEDLEVQLKTSSDLQNELAVLKQSLNILQNVEPCKPNQEIMDTILEKCGLQEEPILVD